MSQIKFGLVLSGGGAKGAYHVGIMRALVECGAEVHAIAGASIGALNGAVLACAPSISDGVKRLESLWQELENDSPLQPNYFRILTSVGMRVGYLGALKKFSTLLKLSEFAKKTGMIGDAAEMLGFLGNSTEDGLLKSDPLNELMDRFLDIDALAKGLPLYVSVYPSKGWKYDIVRIMEASFGLKDTDKSHFIHIQKLPLEDQKKALMASAALPFLFDSQEINGQVYTDGGQGGWRTSQGNTPIRPLIDAGCSHVIVTHLSDGSLWSRQDFPEATVFEIRPKQFISREGARDLIGFSHESISSWINQGYDDTMACIGPIMRASQARHELKESKLKLEHTEQVAAATECEMIKALDKCSTLDIMPGCLQAATIRNSQL